MQVIYNEHLQELAQEAASIISEILNDVLKKKDTAVLGLPGGRSVKDLFEALKEEEIDWSKVHIFLVDERKVPPDSEDSNLYLIKEQFLDHIKIPEVNVHPFTDINTYEEEIKALGGKYDLIILGAGEDGHIAGLFPQLSVLENDEYFIEFDNSPKPPAERMSASRELLLQSKAALILFMGKNKLEAYKRFSNKSTTIEDCPAKLVEKIPEHYIITNLEVEE